MKFLCLVSLIGIALLGGACSESNKGANLTASNTTGINTANTNAAATTPSAPTGDELAAGQALFKKNCAACHRDTGTGGKITIEGRTINPDNLTSDRKKSASDEKFHKWITEGAPDDGMPPFKDKLSDEQITQIVQYIRKGLQQQQ
jgi:mono/diheme cytochrome c family protein